MGGKRISLLTRVIWKNVKCQPDLEGKGGELQGRGEKESLGFVDTFSQTLYLTL